MMYDPLTVLAGVDSLREKMFAPVDFEVDGVIHQVIGVSAVQHGVKNSAYVTKQLVTRFLGAIRLRGGRGRLVSVILEIEEGREEV